ncbi:MAG: hypothetical protein C0467_24025 [Planctomycetaceae bacterium]|nr:hypothetical protein [Planctomycetaceae bacterium]
MIELAGAKGDVTHLAFSPDSRLVAGSGGGRGLELWDVTTANKWGKYTGITFHDWPITFHPTQPVCFMLALNGLAEIETNTKKASVLHLAGQAGSYIGFPAMMPNGGGFVCHTANHLNQSGNFKRLRWTRGKPLRLVWEVKVTGPTPRALQGLKSYIFCVMPHGKTFLTLFGKHVHRERRYLLELTHLTMHSSRDGELLQTTKLPSDTALAMATSPDSRTVVTCHNNNLCVWVAADMTGTPRQVRGNNRSQFTAIAFHPSGKYLAATSNDATVKLYDTTTWQVAKTFTWNIGRMRSIAFSPDGTLAAAGSDTGKVVVWDVDV